MLDLVLRGGKILDGTGAPALDADVGIAGDTIERIGDLSRAEARTVLDLSSAAAPDAAAARSKVVAPGFIDTHSHSDAYLLIEPSAPSKLFQGVTTEIVGNCGASAAPISGAYRMPSDWRGLDYPAQWSTMGGYRALLERVRPAVNVVALVGHGALRAGVVGYDNRPATSSELESMIRLLEQAMDEGARGLSTGLIYPPGLFADTDELVALAHAAGRRDGIYTSHMRSEGKGLLDAIDETLDIGERADIRVQISHLKTAGSAHWRLLDPALDRIRRARDRGTRVAADRYPYTSSHTSLDTVLPAWAHEGGNDALLSRLRDPAERTRLREALAGHRDRPLDVITIGSTRHPDNRDFQGRPLVEVAERLGMEPADAILRLIETDEARTGAFFSGMSEENMFRIFSEPYVMVGSDASLRALTGPLSLDYPHPRAYGTFPRFLRMSLDGRTVPLPEAIRKITSLPASHFGLAGRGAIAAGARADVVVFDPARVRDVATFADPRRLAEGIEAVIVNGVLTLHDGRLTGARGGRFL
jgi:N-acyl-D-amino-acid deacylase